MRRSICTGALLVFVLGVTAASAQDISASDPVISRGGQGWSLHSGQTVGAGATVGGAQIGWPGLSATLLHGATSEFDVGVRLTPLNYGFEGRVQDTHVGIKLQGVARLQFLERDRFNLGAEFAPGPLFYFPRAARTVIGLALPLRVAAGLRVGSAILLNFGMDMPMFVVFGGGARSGFYLPILFGGGAEYFIDRKLSVNFNMKFGPSIHTRFNETAFAMDVLVGVGYRF
jgi:hypothetical protein